MASDPSKCPEAVFHSNRRHALEALTTQPGRAPRRSSRAFRDMQFASDDLGLIRGWQAIEEQIPSASPACATFATPSHASRKSSPATIWALEFVRATKINLKPFRRGVDVAEASLDAPAPHWSA